MTLQKKSFDTPDSDAMVYDVAYIFIFSKASCLHGYIEMTNRYDLLEVSERKR